MANRYKFFDEKGEHRHELDGKPLIGTSTVLSVLSKPLTWWASGLAVAELGWLNSKTNDQNKRIENVRSHLEKIKTLDEVEYLNLLDKAYKAHSVKLKTSAESGIDMHAELEKYVKWCQKHNGGIPAPTMSKHEAVKIFAGWSVNHLNRFIVSEGHCYSEKLWVGGIIDCVAESKERKIGIIDFKSAKEAYFSHFMQCAGYDIEITENGVYDEHGKNLYELERPIEFYAVFPFGMEKPEPTFDYNTKEAKEAFEAALKLYKIINQNRNSEKF